MALKNQAAIEMKIAVGFWNKPKIDLPGRYFVTLASDAPTLLIVPSIMHESIIYDACKVFWRLYRWERKAPPLNTLTEARA